jgi:hypothetical protein
MRLLRNIGSGMKKVASGIRKGMDITEKVVSAADAASGGLIRSMANTATAGLSERALEQYNANKRTVRTALDTTKKLGHVTEKAGRQGIVGSGAWTMAKEHAGARGKDYMKQAEGLAQANPKIYQAMTKPNFMIKK